MKFNGEKMAIARADAWYHQRAKRNYSFEDNLNMTMIFARSARELGINDGFVDSMIKSNLRYDRMMYESKRTFARHLESKAEFYTNPAWLWIHGVSAEDTKRYIDPLFENLSKVDSFVARIDASGGDSISDSGIDAIFLDNFGGVCGFTEFEMDYMDGYSLLLHAQANARVIDKKSYEKTSSALKAFKAPLRFVGERVFHDLVEGGK